MADTTGGVPGAGGEGAGRPRQADLRVLVVDDNKDAADSLGLLLRLWGFDVRVAYDGREALAAASAYRPDCLLSDLGLPGVDGYHLARHVRRDEALKGVTLVAITASPDEARAKAAGFDHHFVKPADPQAVEGMLRKLRATGKGLDQAGELVRRQGEVVPEARGVMRQAKEGVREVRRERKEVEGEQGRA